MMNALLAKCWSDASFRQAMMAHPVATMKAEGLDVPDGVSIAVHEASASHTVLVIPQKPTDLTDDQLDAVAAGSWADFVDWLNSFSQMMTPKPGK